MCYGVSAVQERRPPACLSVLRKASAPSAKLPMHVCRGCNTASNLPDKALAVGHRLAAPAKQAGRGWPGAHKFVWSPGEQSNVEEQRPPACLSVLRKASAPSAKLPVHVCRCCNTASNLPDKALAVGHRLAAPAKQGGKGWPVAHEFAWWPEEESVPPVARGLAWWRAEWMRSQNTCSKATSSATLALEESVLARNERLGRRGRAALGDFRLA